MHEHVHTPTEILEFDVHAQERGQGLGRSLLRFALDTVHPEDDLLLDVSEGNVSAQRYYERLGFTFTDNEPQDHGIFANPDGSPHYHLQMSAPMSIVGQNLG
jgi:ribosomal protein S18 acetylase RimI-like enzyme